MKTLKMVESAISGSYRIEVIERVYEYRELIDVKTHYFNCFSDISSTLLNSLVNSIKYNYNTVIIEVNRDRMNEDKDIDYNAHYFILLHPLEGVPFLGGLCFTSSSTREKWVECEIVDVTFGKIRLHSVEVGYGGDSFYIEDFISHIKNGHVIKKVNEKQHVEEVCCGVDFLCKDIPIITTAYVVTE